MLLLCSAGLQKICPLLCNTAHQYFTGVFTAGDKHGLPLNANWAPCPPFLPFGKQEVGLTWGSPGFALRPPCGPEPTEQVRSHCKLRLISEMGPPQHIVNTSVCTRYFPGLDRKPRNGFSPRLHLVIQRSPCC